jgi:hypothetical protein
MIAPEHRHFAHNAASMLQSGRSAEEVTNSMKQMGFDSGQIRELLDLAQQIANAQVSAPKSLSDDAAIVAGKRWWQFWK